MRSRARPTTKADETPEFVAFWNAWRPHMNRNDGRGAARDEFVRHVEEHGADPQDIADGAKWFIHNGGNSGEFRVHAQTWLNRRPYEDGAELWRAYQQRLSERDQQSSNVTPIRAVLPDHHFSREWERMQQRKVAGE